jgi:hypothetical protein
MSKASRRQELLAYLETGRLRDAVAGDLSEAAQDLLIDIVSRYCEPRRKRNLRADSVREEDR